MAKITKQKSSKQCCSLGACPCCSCCICICTKELKKMLSPDAQKLLLNALH